jgi:hypothetical protein
VPGTISKHHVEYRIRAGATALHALIPSLDRALESSLGDALAERLATTFGDDEEVVVVREARVEVALTADDCRLGSSVANRVSTAAAQSIAAILKAPQSADQVARFENQAAFAGAFIIDLLASRAWDRWCYGPFRRYRRATMRETVAAVLDENDRAGILRWLRSHGHDDVCAILESDARPTDRETESRARHASSNGSAALVDAAHRILRALGWSEDTEALHHAVRALIAHREIPAWTDVRQLSTWVLDLVSAVLDETVEDWTPAPAALDRLDAVLNAGLDWLDVPFVRGEIQRVTASTPLGDHIAGELSRPRDTPADVTAAVLRNLTLRIRAGLVPLAGISGPDAMLSRLLDAARVVDVERRVPEDQLVVALRSVARSWWMKTVTALGARDLERNVMPGDANAPGASGDKSFRTAESQVADRQAAPSDAAAAALLDALSKPSDDDEAAGVWTAAAGLFLLTRPVLDLRLAALAHECGLPLPSVLALIAQALFGLTLPLDAASAAWVGDAEPRRLEEHEGAKLKQLQRIIELTVADQGVLGAGSQDPDIHPIAAHVVRAWARWLPGVHGSSVGYLVRNCLTRTGTVRVTRVSLDVRLDPAPLDVVLEMAGCFRPIDAVGWLDGRRMTFTRSR